MASENTPESDLGSIECFQNYTASEVFIQGLAGIVDQQDVEAMVRAQKQMLQRFEKTNEMLTNCNALSVNRLASAGTEFKKHTQLLVDMKKDLDQIFRRINSLKARLSNQYPQAFAAVPKPVSTLLDEEGEDLEDPEGSLDGNRTPVAQIAMPLVEGAGPVTVGTEDSNDEKEEERERERQLRRGGTLKSNRSSSTDSNNEDNSSQCSSDTG
ncbi:kxDL motif-containing protein CG10681 isoform X1 [Frankliniella occidentalis]|uniref:KxDL motif-containing protein CG10681 isoform X1 n=1 Tax=Frankliniella occidentalis TaxID=133901 RepID=A0A6J1TUY0_FRAOC|nr:kxDL motif-containing protein CG10681 isoform X1 [Frankliniella occidentalis]